MCQALNIKSSEIPWEGGHFAPFLHTESTWAVTAPQGGKALIGNAGSACNKLEESRAHFDLANFTDLPEEELWFKWELR